ncbi:porin [Escherichia coli]|nr:porin [Escherichia coli]WCE55859.1 porin [Escherichia coli]
MHSVGKSNTDDNNSEKTEDTSYVRFGVKGETQITSELTGFGQFEVQPRRQQARRL